MEEMYNGDLKLALRQIENGNWSNLSREEIDLLKSKEQIQESIEEYLTIFNMYKQFHKKQEVTTMDKATSSLDLATNVVHEDNQDISKKSNSSENAKKNQNIDNSSDKNVSKKENLELSEENLQAIAQLIVTSQNSM